jgi:cell division protein FtsW
MQTRIKAIYQKLEGDRVIWMAAFFLGLLSILAVFSAMTTLAVKNGGYGQFLKHVGMLSVGFGIMYFVHKRRFKFFLNKSAYFYLIAAALLVITIFFGTNINNAGRWIRIPGIGISFQSSDIAKIALIIFTASWLHKRREKLDDFNGTITPLLGFIGIICLLILPSNFSTAAMLALVCFVLMYIAGVPWRHLFKIIGFGVGFLVLIIMLGEFGPKGILPRYDTWKNRILNKVDADSEGNYQSNLAQYAIYQGGVIPKGPGTSTTRNFLPHPYSDMVYAFVIEEYGSILGGAGLLLIYIILFFRTVRFTSKCDHQFGRLVAIGLSLLLVVQALINMGVSVNLFPTTGQPLPLVSLGGTSTILTCISIGIILSVSRSVYNPEAYLASPAVDEEIDEEVLIEENTQPNDHSVDTKTNQFTSV